MQELLTPAQSRMARAILRWTLVEAGKASDTGQTTIHRFENEKPGVKIATIKRLQAAYEAAGCRFLFEYEGQPSEGVAPPKKDT